MNLADMIERNARRRPDHPAIVDGRRVLTHGALSDRVDRWAARFAGLGVGAGDIVGVNLKDTAEHLIALYAIARAGAALLPMDWRWTETEKSRIAGHFGAKCVLSEPEDGFAACAGPWRSLRIDEEWMDAAASAPSLRGFARPDDAPLMLSLSSGTTGTPKGPLVTHRQTLARFMIYFVTLGFDERMRFLCATPLYFGGARGYTMCALYAGGTVVLHPPPYEPSDLVAAANAERATMLFLVPTLLRRVLALEFDAPPPAFRTLDGLFSTGAVLHPEERADIMARLCPRYLNLYGSTDGGGCTALTWRDSDEAAASVGRPVFGAEIQIVDPAHRPVASGEVGRIRYRHDGTALGYHNAPAASREAFRDGWYYPGDLGWLDRDGFLYLAGRAKDVIIRGGVNIYPAEIEHVLSRHPAVYEAAVVGRPSREFGEEAAAFVVRESGPAGAVDEAALIAHCAGTLARYKLPRDVLFVDDLPKSGVGKVLKSELAARLDPLP